MTRLSDMTGAAALERKYAIGIAGQSNMYPLRISKSDLSPPSKSNQDHRPHMPSYSLACSVFSTTPREKHRQNRHSETPNSPLTDNNLWHTLSVVLQLAGRSSEAPREVRVCRTRCYHPLPTTLVLPSRG